MKTYVRPDAEIIELECEDNVMNVLGSGEFGFEEEED